MATCSICKREDVEKINHDLFSGRYTQQQVADKYHVTPSTLCRHKAHTKTQLIQAGEATESDPLTAIQRVNELDDRAEQLYRSCLKKGDNLNAIRALKEMRELVSLAARLNGELNQNVIHNHLHISPEWAVLRAAILQALQPYPEARAAILDALRDQNALVEVTGDVT